MRENDEQKGTPSFEAWSELVGWGRQVDAASQTGHPIMNTTFKARSSNELKTIARNLRGET